MKKYADSRLCNNFCHPDLLTKLGHAVGTSLVKFVATRSTTKSLK